MHVLGAKIGTFKRKKHIQTETHFVEKNNHVWNEEKSKKKKKKF